ncbi:type II toxin-antitoxin system death-on-curing family toxin [Aureispira anguillae]|uniref:Type II toxin-antitoxin system death-on-curing family toxin n=1 Tax=Aureispira anguillae TaxID=2864201 RepID=A0A915YJ34_9BACT|nr:type II toxin-antitoxin system death-on-curing family toxin [Aureispira anguillae]BDS13891.1 type II toxin-antitoxin system death-on-curing family toxin [Aureispira anguillae]
MNFVKKEEIISMNQAIITRYGGSFSKPKNLKNEDALNYLLDIVENNVVFGEAQYPSIAHVAALFLFKITSNHIFNDGNKRTALKTMNYFLFLNDCKLKDKLYVAIHRDQLIPKTSNYTVVGILEGLIQEIAQGKINYDDVLDFLRKNIEES